MRNVTYRRLECSRRIRSVPGRARNSAEAVMWLAQVARERHRLEQERRSLDLRMAKIQKRLGAIADAETRLVPLIHLGTSTIAAAEAGPAITPPPPRRHAVPPGVTEITLQY